MEDDEDDSYLEPEDITCNKCGKLIVLPKYDGPYDISDSDMYCDLSELIEIVFHLDSEVIK